MKTKPIENIKDVKVNCNITPKESLSMTDLTYGKEYLVYNKNDFCVFIIDDVGESRGITEDTLNIRWNLVEEVESPTTRPPTSGDIVMSDSMRVTKPIRGILDVGSGDRVICVSDQWVDITEGKEYSIRGTGVDCFDIIDDANDIRDVHENDFKDWRLVVSNNPTTIPSNTALLFDLEQNINNVWTIIDDLDMIQRSWDDMTDSERKGVIEGISLLGNLKMVKLHKCYEELFRGCCGYP